MRTPLGQDPAFPVEDQGLSVGRSGFVVGNRYVVAKEGSLAMVKRSQTYKDPLEARGK